jgi:hypothetical protein
VAFFCYLKSKGTFFVVDVRLFVCSLHGSKVINQTLVGCLFGWLVVWLFGWLFGGLFAITPSWFSERNGVSGVEEFLTKYAKGYRALLLAKMNATDQHDQSACCG